MCALGGPCWRLNLGEDRALAGLGAPLVDEMAETYGSVMEQGLGD